MSDPATKTVAFTDSSCETAPIIRDFLHLASTGTLPETWDDGLEEGGEFVQRIAGVVTFLKKYQCDATLHILKLGFNEGFLMSGYYSLEGIILGANADDVEYCIKAIKASEWTQDEEADNTDVDPIVHIREGALELLPCNMPFKAVQLIPVEYYWALSRSWLGNKDTWPDEFRRLLAMAKGSR